MWPTTDARAWKAYEEILAPASERLARRLFAGDYDGAGAEYERARELANIAFATALRERED